MKICCGCNCELLVGKSFRIFRALVGLRRRAEFNQRNEPTFLWLLARRQDLRRTKRKLPIGGFRVAYKMASDAALAPTNEARRCDLLVAAARTKAAAGH